jgi:uncharacterized membrane protein YccC
VIALLATFFLWPSREPSRFSDRLAKAVSANLSYLSAALGQVRDNEIELERQRRAAGLASNNAEEVLARLRLEKLDTTHDDRTGSTALALLRRVAGTATRARFGTSDTLPNEHLAAWIQKAGQGIEARLAGKAVDNAEGAFPKQGLSLLEADAVNQVVLLRRLLVEMPAG